MSCCQYRGTLNAARRAAAYECSSAKSSRVPGAATRNALLAHVPAPAAFVLDLLLGELRRHADDRAFLDGRVGLEYFLHLER